MQKALWQLTGFAIAKSSVRNGVDTGQAETRPIAVIRRHFANSQKRTLMRTAKEGGTLGRFVRVWSKSRLPPMAKWAQSVSLE